MNSKRQDFFIVGVAATRMVNRWKVHKWSSKLSNNNNRAPCFYSMHPSQECDINNLPHEDTLMRSFEQLNQYISIRISQVDKDAVVFPI